MPERAKATHTFQIDGMTCESCERRIERALAAMPGVISAAADCMAQTAAVTYDPSAQSLSAMAAGIEAAGYRVETRQKNSRGNLYAGLGLLALAGLFIAANALGAQLLPRVDSGASLALLFVTGLLGSLHCVAMCGGIALSQCAGKRRGWVASLLYNAGRAISYALIGGLVGALGSVVPLTAGARGGITLVAGAFMLISGLNMLGAFPWLRRLSPRLPRWVGAIRAKLTGGGPFAIGLLNGLMPCGPLQSMQLYALGTGSFAAGALSMLAFALGTVPLMFVLGAGGSLLSAKSAGRMVKLSAALVVALGVMTLGRGLNLGGGAVPADALVPVAETQQAQAAPDVQYIAASIGRSSYPTITVQAGVPVEWTLNAAPGSLNGCNDVMQIPEYGLQVALQEGDNIIQFTPGEPGTVPYSCWMGMIRGRIEVVQ